MGLLGQVSRDVMVRPRSRGRLGGRQAICNGRGDSGNCERRVAEAVGKENGFTKYNGMIKDALSCRVAIMEVTTVFLFSFMLSATTSTKGKKKLKYSTELFKRLTTSFHETKVTASRENANCNSSHHIQERRAMLEASALQGERQTKG